MSNQTQRRPAMTPGLAAADGGATGSRWRASELLCCALQSDARHAAGVAEASEAVQPCPKGSQALRLCTLSRHEEGLPVQQPTSSPMAVPKIFVTALLAPGRRLDVGPATNW